jgi:hypothetical protein
MMSRGFAFSPEIGAALPAQDNKALACDESACEAFF